ncbi:MAG: sialidase family protein [Cyclobacteriaceae bacterium]
MMLKIHIVILVFFLTVWHSFGQQSQQSFEARRNIDIPTLDISDENSRQVVIAPGTEQARQGHPHTILLPDGKTMFVIWTIGHGGPADQLKKSEDGGLTWSDLLEVPENWKHHANCPPLYLLEDPEGNSRLTTFVNRGPAGFKMYRAFSEDYGDSWSPFHPVLLPNQKDTLIADVMPFTAIIPVEGGDKLLGFSNIRRPYEGGRTNIIAQSISKDGGITWGHWRIILDLGDPHIPCEPEVIRSPDGKQLLMIIRENNRSFNSWIMLSDNEGKTWQEPFQAHASVTMDRHQAQYANDGRLVIVGRDVAENSPSKGHFAAWVGTYDDLAKGREGQYRIKLLHTYKTTEYPGLNKLPDGTFVATNSVVYREGENYSIISTRFRLDELDKKLK